MKILLFAYSTPRQAGEVRRNSFLKERPLSPRAVIHPRSSILYIYIYVANIQ